MCTLGHARAHCCALGHAIDDKPMPCDKDKVFLLVEVMLLVEEIW